MENNEKPIFIPNEDDSFRMLSRCCQSNNFLYSDKNDSFSCSECYKIVNINGIEVVEGEINGRISIKR